MILNAFFSIEMKITDPEGNTVKEQTSRIGEEWQWHPEAKKLKDNNLNPREERVYSIEYLPQKRIFTL